MRRAYIGGGKAKFSPLLIALNHSPHDRIETTKQECSFVHTTLQNPLTDHRAADYTPINGDRFYDVHEKAMVPPQFLEERNRTVPSLAESEVVSDIDLSNPDRSNQHILDECHGGQICKQLGEWQADDHIEPTPL